MPKRQIQGTVWLWGEQQVTEEVDLGCWSKVRNVGPFWSFAPAPNPPLSKPRLWGLHWYAAASFRALHPHTCLTSWAPVTRYLCVICLCGSFTPLPWTAEDCFALSSFCPDLFHFPWRLTSPRLQPVKFSVPLYADLPESIQLMTSCSSLTTLPGSL